MGEDVKFLLNIIDFAGNKQKQIVAYGNPNLCEYCILAGSEERFYAQMLLYPLEEQLYLPAFTVQLCNRNCLMKKIVRQKAVDIACGEVLVNDKPH